METLLYYPGFEVENINWLKFALLYLNKLRPIIPPEGDKYLSDNFKFICDETDLIDKYRPNYEEGYTATLDAIDTIEKILSHPDRYSPIFKTTQIHLIWKNPKNLNVSLFEDKYTDIFEEYVLRNSLAKKTTVGLSLSLDIANIYMSILAHVISDLRTISPITDLNEMDKFSIFTRYKNIGSITF